MSRAPSFSKCCEDMPQLLGERGFFRGAAAPSAPAARCAAPRHDSTPCAALNTWRSGLQRSVWPAAVPRRPLALADLDHSARGLVRPCRTSGNSWAREGERAAEKFLRQQRYTIVARNYRCRSGEVDLIALDRSTVVFIEVKTRTQPGFGTPVRSRRSPQAAPDPTRRAALYHREPAPRSGRPLRCRRRVVGGRPRAVRAGENAFEAK